MSRRRSCTAGSRAFTAGSWESAVISCCAAASRLSYAAAMAAASFCVSTLASWIFSSRVRRPDQTMIPAAGSTKIAARRISWARIESAESEVMRGGPP
jgi:hypothetical protein